MQARFVTMCNELLPVAKVHRLLNSAGIKLSLAQRFIPFLDLELPVREAIHNGTISDKTAYELCNMPAGDRLFLVSFFTQLSLNSNKQRRLLELARIVATREKTSLQELLEGYLDDVSDHEEKTNIPQTVSTLMRVLFEKSHPMSCAADHNFAEQVKQFQFPAHISVHHSQSFERNNVSLEINFDNLDKLAEKADTIASLFKH